MINNCHYFCTRLFQNIIQHPMLMVVGMHGVLGMLATFHAEEATAKDQEYVITLCLEIMGVRALVQKMNSISAT